MLVIEPYEWFKLVHPSVMLLSGLVYTETPLVLFGNVFRPHEVEVTDQGLGVHMWRHRSKTNTSGWRTCTIASRRLVTLHEPFQDCGQPFAWTPHLPPSTLRAHAPAATPVPIGGAIWENEKLYCSQMNLDLVWIIQMVGLWCTAGWASATKMHAFDRDERLAVGVWWWGWHLSPWQDTPGHY